MSRSVMCSIILNISIIALPMLFGGCGSVPDVYLPCFCEDGDADAPDSAEAVEPEPRQSGWCRDHTENLSGLSCDETSVDINTMLTVSGFPPQNASAICPRIMRSAAPAARVSCSGECRSFSKGPSAYVGGYALPAEDGTTCEHRYEFQVYKDDHHYEELMHVAFIFSYPYDGSNCTRFIQHGDGGAGGRATVSFEYNYNNGVETMQAALYDQQGRLYMAIRNAETLCPGEGVTVSAADLGPGLMPSLPFYGLAVRYEPACDDMCYEIDTVPPGPGGLPCVNLVPSGLSATLDGNPLEVSGGMWGFLDRENGWNIYVPMETRVPVCDGARPFTSGECIVTRPGLGMRRSETLVL